MALSYFLMYSVVFQRANRDANRHLGDALSQQRTGKSKRHSPVTSLAGHSLSWTEIESPAETLKRVQKENRCFPPRNPADIKDVFEFPQLEGAK